MWKTNTAAILRAAPSAFFYINLLIVLWCCSSLWLPAQRSLTLYNLSATPHAYGLNPGRAPLSNVYVGLPLVSHINGSYSNSSFRFGDFSFSGDTSFFSNNEFDSFVGKLDKENRLTADMNIHWADFGFRVGNNFFSFHASDHLIMQLDYPRALFELLQDVSNEELVSRTYVLDRLGFNGTHFRSYGIGYNRVITSQFSIGARVRWLSGMANVATFNQNLKLVNNFDDEYLAIEGLLSAYSSGLQTLENEPDAYLRDKGNRGIAIDFGVNLPLSDRFEIFGSILNLGRIRWKHDLTENTIIAGNVVFPTNDAERFEEEFNNFLDSLQQPSAFRLPSYTTRLPATAYIGGNYYFQPGTSASLLVSPRFYNGRADWAFSLGLQHRLGRVLQVGLNYAAYNRSAFNLGAGLTLNAGPFQIFAASDNILSAFNLSNARNVQLNSGLNLTFGRLTREEQLQNWRRKVPDIALKSKRDPISAPSETASKPAVAKAENQPETQREDTKEIKTKSRTTPAPAPVEEALKPYLSLLGTARSGTDGSALTGVGVEVYRVTPDGREELALITSFLDGNIKVPLQRDFSYRVVVKKPGYFDQEMRVSAAETAAKNEVRKEVTLPLYTLPAATAPVPKAEKPAAPEVKSEPAPPTETYKVLDITDLRAEPRNDGRSIFKLQKGNRVQLLEKTSATWWKVQYVSRLGYVRASALAKVE